MRIRLVTGTAVAALVISLSAVPVSAQQYESVGTRAQGMAGAFVAVADDATATWWNPAGLAGGAYYDTVLEYDTVQQPKEARTPDGAVKPAWESKTRGFAFAYPAMGLSYYRLQLSEIRPFSSTGASSSDRQDQGVIPVSLRTTVLNEFGLTVGQSLSKYVVVASTLKLVRASTASSLVMSPDATFENAHDLEGNASDTKADLDLGVMAKIGVLHLGGSLKNVREPDFGPDDDRQTLKRHGRVGASVITHAPGIDQLTVAFDADVMKTPGLFGDTQFLAAGAEVWLLKRYIGLRGGMSTNTVADKDWAPSMGASLAFKKGSYLEGHYSAGSDTSKKGWGFDLRVTF
jgi:long-chain fatty acid transport protein